MGVEELMTLGQHPISSRVLDAILESPTAPRAAKRKLILAFLGHYHDLADGKIGSRVAERCWSSADVFCRVRAEDPVPSLTNS